MNNAEFNDIAVKYAIEEYQNYFCKKEKNFIGANLWMGRESINKDRDALGWHNPSLREFMIELWMIGYEHRGKELNKHIV